VNNTRIYELITTRSAVITTTTSVRDAARLMTSGHFRHLPVTSDAGLAGIVDIADVCRGQAAVQHLGHRRHPRLRRCPDGRGRACFS
jgi:CBS domain-containing protein